MGTFDDAMTFPADDSFEDPRPRSSGGYPAPGIIKTQTEYQTALAVVKPRDLKEVEARVLGEAARMGTDFVYSWRVKTKDKRLDEGDGRTTIEGMSIDGAMVLARNWGNCAVPIKLESESDTHFVLRADFIDLETGFSFPRLYRQRKNQGQGGGMDADRAEDIAFQIGQSKAQRNVIDKALPEWLIDRATTAAKSAALKKYGDVETWRPRVIASFKTKLGVDESRLVARLKKPADQWTPVEILKLDMIARAIRENESTVGEEFPVGEGAASSETAKTVEDGLRAKSAASPAQTPPSATSAPATSPTAAAPEVRPSGTSDPAAPPKPRKPRAAAAPEDSAQASAVAPTPELCGAILDLVAGGQRQGQATCGLPKHAGPYHRARWTQSSGDERDVEFTEGRVYDTNTRVLSDRAAATPTPPAPPSSPAPTPEPAPAAKVEFKNEHERAEAWNKKHPVGAPVICTDGRTKQSINSTTCGVARVFGDKAVVEVNDGKGGTLLFDLTEVRPFLGG